MHRIRSPKRLVAVGAFTQSVIKAGLDAYLAKQVPTDFDAGVFDVRFADSAVGQVLGHCQ